MSVSSQHLRQLGPGLPQEAVWDVVVKAFLLGSPPAGSAQAVCVCTVCVHVMVGGDGALEAGKSN